MHIKLIGILLINLVLVAVNFSYAGEMSDGNEDLKSPCGRIIAGFHPSIRFGNAIAIVKQIDEVREFEEKTHFRLTPREHSIDFFDRVSSDSTQFKVTIEPDTNYYIQWVTDYTPKIKINHMPRNVKYSGPLIYKTRPKKCEL